MLPVTWWLHIGCGAQQAVLVCGDLDVYSINFLTASSAQVFLYHSNAENRETVGTPIEIQRQQLFERRYSAIVVNQRGLETPLTGGELFTLVDQCLDQSGVFCLYESVNNLSAHLRQPSLLWRRLGGERAMAPLIKALPGSLVSRLQAISYKPRPYEAFPPGRYHNNKNVFLPKERLKRWLLRTPLSRLLVNSNLWVIRKTVQAQSLVEQLFTRIAGLEIPWRGPTVEIIKIMYRPGKIILSLNSDGGSRPELVAVLAFDDISIMQRDCEEAAMSLLDANPNIAPLVADFHLATDFGDYRLYLITEFDGITVDIDNPALPQMTRNAFATICHYGNEFRRLAPGQLDALLGDYINSVVEKFPDLAAELTPVTGHLGHWSCDQLPVVFMHGDAKLENFVLDDAGQVIGIIDFELAEQNGFPLLDTYYLIVYNLLMIRHKRFDIAFQKLVDDELEPWELEMIATNCEAFGIEPLQRENLKLVFFMHHYARRYWVMVRFSESWHVFRSSLEIANRLVQKLAPPAAVEGSAE